VAEHVEEGPLKVLEERAVGEGDLGQVGVVDGHGGDLGVIIILGGVEDFVAHGVLRGVECVDWQGGTVGDLDEILLGGDGDVSKNIIKI
jgi:hypothetical protein